MVGILLSCLRNLFDHEDAHRYYSVVYFVCAMLATGADFTFRLAYHLVIAFTLSHLGVYARGRFQIDQHHPLSAF